MSGSPSKGVLTAVFLAVGLHAILFLVITSSTGSGLTGHPVAPKTSYLASGYGKFPMAGTDIRTLSSPVLFSLPSSMGFSRDFLSERIESQRFEPGSAQSERFLNAPLVQGSSDLDSNELMLSSQIGSEPRVPDDIYGGESKKPSARRVTLAPELKSRVVGGVVLPSELNQEVSKAWEARAEVSVSEDGVVQHVFLQQPLESPELNQSILRLLRGLQFSPGDKVEGTVEIYSPEIKPLVTPVEEVQE